MTEGFQEVRSTVPVLNVSALDHEADHQAERFDNSVALASLILFPASYPDCRRFRWFSRSGCL